MDCKLPVKYYDNNIVFGDKGVWAYYQMEGFHYDFLSDDKQIDLMRRLSAFYWDNATNIHLLVVPKYRDISEVAEEFISEIDGELKEIGIRHMREAANALSEQCGASIEYHFYIGLKLEINEHKKVLQEVKSAWYDFKNSFYNVADLGYVVDEQELGLYKKYEKLLYAKIKSALNVKRIARSDMQHLITRNFNRSNTDTFEITPHYIEKEGKRYIDGRDILRLTESLIDDSSLRYLKNSHGDGDEFVTFLTVSKIPYNMHFPGCEFIYFINQFDFAVDVSIRVSSLTGEAALKLVGQKKESLEAETNYTLESGRRAGNNVLTGEDELHDLEAHLERTEMPLLETSIVFAVTGKDKDELSERVKLVKSIYRKKSRMILEQPKGDQFIFFNEFLPGAEIYVNDYVHVMEPDALASGMFGATKQLGNTTGFPIGYTGLLNRIAYLDPSLPAQGIEGSKTNSLSMSFTGSLGGGKSYCTNLITYLSVLSGARALIVDPKGERSNWVNTLKDLKGQINVITLSSEERYRGLLDPFMILSGKDAEELALSVATYLTGVKNIDIIYFAALADAIEKVGSSPAPCMLKVVEYLLDNQDDAVKNLGKCLKSFTKLSFASLLFGDGEVRETICLKDCMNILQVQNLQLPDKNAKTEDYSLLEILSQAMMIPIASFALKFIESDREIYKIVVMEEAWTFFNNAQGKAVIGKLLREGRALNAGIYLVTQNALDFDSDFKNLIGVKFAFRSDDKKEVESILEYFDLPITEDNVLLIRELPNGCCLFKDMFGRIGVVRISAIFEDLDHAFDTRPPKKGR